MDLGGVPTTENNYSIVYTIHQYISYLVVSKTSLSTPFTIMPCLHCPVLESMRAHEPGLQAPSNLAGSQIFSPYWFFLRDRISNIGKSTRQIVVLILKGRPSNQLIKTLSQYARFRRLRATLNFGWQAPGGILEPGCSLSNHLFSAQLYWEQEEVY